MKKLFLPAALFYFDRNRPKSEVITVDTDDAAEVHLSKNLAYYHNGLDKQSEEIQVDVERLALVSTEIDACTVVILYHQSTNRYWMFHNSPWAMISGRHGKRGYFSRTDKKIYEELMVNYGSYPSLSKADHLDVCIISVGSQEYSQIAQSRIIELEEYFTIRSIKRFNGDDYGNISHTYRICFLPKDHSLYIKYSGKNPIKLGQAFEKKEYRPQWKMALFDPDLKNTAEMIRYYNQFAGTYQNPYPNGPLDGGYTEVLSIKWNPKTQLVDILVHNENIGSSTILLQLWEYKNLSTEMKHDSNFKTANNFFVKLAKFEKDYPLPSNTLKKFPPRASQMLWYFNSSKKKSEIMERFGISKDLEITFKEIVFHESESVAVHFNYRRNTDVISITLQQYYENYCKMKGVDTQYDNVPYASIQ